MPITKPIIMNCETSGRDLSKYNVKTAHAPGIVCDRCETEPYVYKTVFFGATRTYEDDEGWQPASSQRRRKRESNKSRGWIGHGFQEE